MLANSDDIAPKFKKFKLWEHIADFGFMITMEKEDEERLLFVLSLKTLGAAFQKPNTLRHSYCTHVSKSQLFQSDISQDLEDQLKN